MNAGLVREARLSDCGRYRYTLMRRWGDRAGGLTWVMLNPSMADAEIDDPTIRRCMTFTQREGHDAMVVVNLFAMRATNPRDLIEAAADKIDPVGPDNGRWVGTACRQGASVVAAWGIVPPTLRVISDAVIKLLSEERLLSLRCLGATKDGSPRHPLYVRGDTPLIKWNTPTC